MTMLAQALRQTAVELLRLYRDSEISAPHEPLDVDAVAAWERIAEGTDNAADLDLIRMRALDHAPA
jgi:hypothetical protein